MKGEELALIAGAGVVAWIMLKPKKKTPAEQFQDLLTSVVASVGRDRSSIPGTTLLGGAPASSAAYANNAAGIYGNVTPPLFSDNPAVSAVDYTGVTSPGIPAVNPMANNNTLATVGISRTAVMPIGWDGTNNVTGNNPVLPYDLQTRTQGGPIYNGSTPTLTPPPPTTYPVQEVYLPAPEAPAPLPENPNTFLVIDHEGYYPAGTLKTAEELNVGRGTPIAGWYWDGLYYKKL